MLLARLSRDFSSRFFKPATPLQFDSDGKLLLYTTPSATVFSNQTFLRIFAPINLGFILVHGYLSVAEIMYPIIEGRYGYLMMTSSLFGVGIGMAVSVEIFARRFIKNIHLLSDGQNISIDFHSAFLPSKYNEKININDCYGLDEIYSNNFKLSVKNRKALYLNMDRNEVKDEKLLAVLRKVIDGQCVNTVGEKNLNKFWKHY